MLPIPPYWNHQGGCRAQVAARFLAWCCLDCVFAQSKALYHLIGTQCKKNSLRKAFQNLCLIFVYLCTTYMTHVTEIVGSEATVTCLLCMHWVAACGEDHIWNCHYLLLGLTVVCDDW